MRTDRLFILEIGNYLVSSDIITEYFCCDYQKCRGACCIIGDSGAPLKEEEAERLEENYGLYKEYLTPAGKAAINNIGFAVRDQDGDLVTPLVKNAECAYACFDNSGSCYCAIEKAFDAGRCDFRKPESCCLYPIRVSKLSNGKTALNLHRWKICRDAFEKGASQRIPVFRFLREQIIAYFGEELYSSMEEASNSFKAAL